MKTLSWKTLAPALRPALWAAFAMLAMAGLANADDPLPPLSSPEIDPGSMGAALTLLSSGVFLLAGRRRKAS